MPNKINRSPFISIGTETPNDLFKNCFWIDTSDNNYTLKYNFNNEWVSLTGLSSPTPYPIPAFEECLKFGENLLLGDNYKNITFKVNDDNYFLIEKLHCGIKLHLSKDSDYSETLLTNDKVLFARNSQDKLTIFELNKSSISLHTLGQISMSSSGTFNINSGKLNLGDCIVLQNNKLTTPQLSEILIGGFGIKNIQDIAKISAKVQEIDIKNSLGDRIGKISPTATTLNTRLDVIEPERGNYFRVKKDGIETLVLNSDATKIITFKATAGGNPLNINVLEDDNLRNILHISKDVVTLEEGKYNPIFISGIGNFYGINDGSSYQCLQKVIKDLVDRVISLEQRIALLES